VERLISAKRLKSIGAPTVSSGRSFQGRKGRILYFTQVLGTGTAIREWIRNPQNLVNHIRKVLGKTKKRKEDSRSAKVALWKRRRGREGSVKKLEDFPID